jgi:sulfopyruvate decarboxylase subunit beta
MKRIDCLKALAEITKDDDLVVTNLGNTPHEWLSVRPSRANLYGMNLGQCTPVALGLALALPHRRVFALDGDGNLLLNLGSLADTAHRKPSNLRIIVFDNEAYESPGGMPTATAHGVTASI